MFVRFTPTAAVLFAEPSLRSPALRVLRVVPLLRVINYRTCQVTCLFCACILTCLSKYLSIHVVFLRLSCCYTSCCETIEHLSRFMIASVLAWAMHAVQTARVLSKSDGC